LLKRKGVRKRSFLPGPGQGGGDPGADFLVGCLVVLLEAAWGLTTAVAAAALALVGYVLPGGWRKK
jgi:hypothetical protein